MWIKLGNLLNLKPADVGKGFVQTVRLAERDDDAVVLYCRDEKSFHERYFPMRHCRDSKDDGISLCFLELSKSLWLLTKALRRNDGHPEEIFQEFSGRLMVQFHKKNHSGAVDLKRQLDKMYVHSILDRRYNCWKFHGYDQVRIDFASLQKIVEMNLSDWQAALMDIAAIYQIADKLRGGAYVGSACGKDGLWGRWRMYATGRFRGTGNDVGLEERMDKDPDYAKNFEFAILEVHNKKKSENEIIDRENWWKETLRTRRSHNNNGMNLN